MKIIALNARKMFTAFVDVVRSTQKKRTRFGNTANLYRTWEVHMAFSLSSACLSIALADKCGTLRLVERASRFGDTFIAISDEFGMIEVANDMAEANQRVERLRQRAA